MVPIGTRSSRHPPAVLATQQFVEPGRFVSRFLEESMKGSNRLSCRILFTSRPSCEFGFATLRLLPRVLGLGSVDRVAGFGLTGHLVLAAGTDDPVVTRRALEEVHRVVVPIVPDGSQQGRA